MFPSVWFGYLLHFTHSLLAGEDGVGPNIIKSKHASLSREKRRQRFYLWDEIFLSVCVERTDFAGV